MKPIDMVLHCPECGAQHIDAPDPEPPMAYALGMCASRSRPEWTNPPHRTHLCRSCSHKWRPADVATNGVAAVKTCGKDDSPIADMRAVVADAERMRWILAGNGYFLEESSLPGSSDDARERDFTRSGLIIGLRAPPRQQPVGRHAEIVQAVLLHPRPLRWDQMFVRALLKVTHDQTA